MSGAAGVLICDQLMWHPKQRGTAVEDTEKWALHHHSRSCMRRVILREQCDSASAAVNNFIMGISDRFFVVFPHDSSEIRIHTSTTHCKIMGSMFAFAGSNARSCAPLTNV